MYIFGGQFKTSSSENTLYIYDFEKNSWDTHKHEGEPLSIDSHNALLHENDKDGAKMYILFGYLNEIGEFSNAIYEFDFFKKSWNILSERNKS